VSDEYSPFITHFDRNGRALQRLSPFDGSLPAELANRVLNKGMEGLTVTPAGHRHPQAAGADEDRHRHGRHAGGWHLVVLLKAPLT